MAVALRESRQEYTFLSSDTKPTAGLRAGVKGIETDTGIEYIFNGTAWVPVNSGRATVTHTQPSIGATTTAALAANANRKYVLLVNDSDSIIYVKIGVAAVMNQGIRLNAAGGSYEMTAAAGNVDVRAINAISSGATKALLVTEGV